MRWLEDLMLPYGPFYINIIVIVAAVLRYSVHVSRGKYNQCLLRIMYALPLAPSTKRG